MMSGKDFLLAAKLGQRAEVEHYVSNNGNINYQNKVNLLCKYNDCKTHNSVYDETNIEFCSDDNNYYNGFLL